MKKGKKKGPKKYYSWELEPIIRETERLQMQMLLRESDAIFQEFLRKMRQAEEAHLAAPACEQTETE